MENAGVTFMELWVRILPPAPVDEVQVLRGYRR